jgi:hypothetical protein
MVPRNSGRDLAPVARIVSEPVAVASSGPFPRPLFMRLRSEGPESGSSLKSNSAFPRRQATSAERRAAAAGRHPSGPERVVRHPPQMPRSPPHRKCCPAGCFSNPSRSKFTLSAPRQPHSAKRPCALLPFPAQCARYVAPRPDCDGHVHLLEVYVSAVWRGDFAELIEETAGSFQEPAARRTWRRVFCFWAHVSGEKWRTRFKRPPK